ncbi:MAG: PH domain-containing protein [Dethiobacter sp.]|nr:PH domain-containing protein [Dethiobacter sp.]
MYFLSKYDWWLTAIIISGILLLAFSALGSSSSVIVFINTGISIFICWVFFGTGYRVLDEKLIIRGGPVKWTVALSDVTSIKPSRSLLSAPASSMDRLEIRHKKGAVIISPKDKEGFLKLMKERCPSAYISQ